MNMIHYIITSLLHGYSAFIFYLLIYVIPSILVYQVIRWLISQSFVPSAEKAVLITGCDTGFGRMLAEQLDTMGCHVIATCLSQSAVDDLSEKLSSHSLVLLMDVSSQSSVELAHHEVDKYLSKNHQGLWGLINNAGIAQTFGPFEFAPLSLFEKETRVNYLGTVSVTRTFLPFLRKSYGRIINMSSMAGFSAGPYVGAYCGSKFAVEGFSDCIRRELSIWGISVHVIEPGFQRTPITDPARFKSMIGRWENWEEVHSKIYGQDYPRKVESMIRYLLDLLEWNLPGLNGNPQNVVDTYMHALFSRFPFIRYRIGLDCIVPYIFQRWIPLPDALWDKLLTPIDPKQSRTDCDYL